MEALGWSVGYVAESPQILLVLILYWDVLNYTFTSVVSFCTLASKKATMLIGSVCVFYP
jgi:hypothetical protein